MREKCLNLTVSKAVANVLTNSSGTFDLNGQNLTVSGGFSNNNGILKLQGGETVNFVDGMDTAHGTVVYNGTGNYPSLNLGIEFNNLTFHGTGTWALGALTVNGVLTIEQGTVNQLTNGITLANYAQTGGTYHSSPSYSFGDNGYFNFSGGVFTRFTGSGTSGSPYEIYDAYGLQGMNSTGYLDKYFQLAGFIDASIAQVDSWNSNTGFVPIGNLATPFTGTLDGNQYTIFNLYINGATNYTGLFGVIGGAGTVENLGIKNAVITSSGNYTGGLAGKNDGTISDDYVVANVTGTGSYTGVVVGYSDGTIQNASAIGSAVGGAGSDTGGFVGYNSGSITDSYAADTVTTGTNVGGFVGTDNSGSYTSDYWDSTVSSAVEAQPSGVNAETTAQMQTQGTFVGWAFGTVWQLVGTNYPFLIWEYPSYIYGTVYSDAGLTGLASATVNLYENGVFFTSVTTNSVGQYAFLLLTALTNGDDILVNVSGSTTKANTVTVVNTPYLSSFNLYANAVSVKSGTISNADLSGALGSLSGANFLYSMSGGVFTDTGNFWIPAGTTYAPGADSYIGGSWTNYGTLTPGMNTIFFNSTSTGNTITSTGETFYNITFNGAAGSWQLKNDIAASNILTIAANSTLDLAGYNLTAASFVNNGTLKLKGVETVSTPTNNAGSLVQYYGTAGPYTINNWTYDSLELASSTATTYNLGADLTVNNTLTIDTNDILDLAGYNLSAVSFVNNGTLRLEGSETVSAPTNNTGSTVIYYGNSGPYTIKNWNYSNLEFLELSSMTPTVYMLQANLTVGGTVIIAVNNTLDLAGYNVSATSIVNNGTIRLEGSETVSTPTNNNGSLVQYYGTSSPYTVKNWTYYDLEFSSSSAATYNLGANLTVNDTLTIDAGNTLDVSGHNITAVSFVNNGTLRLRGSETISTPTNNAGSLVQYYGTSGPYTIKNWAYENLELSSSSTTTYNLGANLSVNSTLTIDVNNILDVSGHNITAGTFVNNGTLKLQGTETITAPTNNAGSLVQYYGTSGPYTINNWTYDSLELSSSSTTTYDLAHNLTVNATLTIDSGNILDVTGYNVTALSFVNNGTLRLEGSETITAPTNNTGSLVQYYGTSGPYTINNWTYANLELASGSATTYNLGANLTVNSTLTIDTGNTLDAAGHNITATSIINNGTLRLKGSETISTPTNNAGSLVQYYGTSGPYTIKNWTYDSVEFASGSATTYNLGANLTVNNTLTIDAGNTLDAVGHNITAASFVNNGILRLQGSETVSTPTNNAGSLVQYYGTSGPYTINNWTYANLELSSASTTTYNLGANLTVNTTLTIDVNNVLDVAGHNITATTISNSGTLKLQGAETISTVTNNSGALVQYYGTSGPYTVKNWVYYNLEFSSSSSTTYNLGANLTVNNLITIDSGNTLDLVGHNLTAASFANNGILRLQGSETASTPTNNTGSLVQYYGTSGPYTIKNWTYYDLELSSSSSTTYSLAHDLTVNNTATIDANNILDVSSHNVTAASFVNNGTIRLQGTETITVPTNNVGSLVQYYGTSGPYTVYNWTYANLELASSSATTYNLAHNLTVNSTLTIDANDTLDLSGYNLTVTTVINNGILRLKGSEVVTVTTVTNNASSLVQYYGTSGPYTVYNWTYDSLEFSSASTTTYNLGANLAVNATLTIDVNNILDLSSHNLTAVSFINNGTLRLKGSETSSVPTNNVGSLVQYYGTSGPYTVKNWTYYDLEFSSSSATTYNLGADLTVNHTLTIDVLNTLDVSGHNLTATTSFINNGILRLQGTETITTPTNNAGSLVQYYGTSGPYTIKNWTYDSLELASASSTTYVLGNNLTVNSTLTIDVNNTLDVSGYNVTASSIVNKGILRLEGSETVSTVTNNSGSLVQYYGTSGPYTIKNWTYDGLELASSSATTYNLGANLTVNNTVTIDVNNTLDLAGHNLSSSTIANNGILRLRGSETVSTVTNNAGSLVQYYGMSGPYTVKNWTYDSLEFSSASTTTYNLGANLTVNATLTIDSNNILDIVGHNVSATSFVNNGTLRLHGDETVSAPTNNAGSLVQYYGTSGPYTINNWTYNSLELSSSSTTTYNLGANLTVNSILTIDVNNVLDVAGHNISAAVFVNNGTLRLQGSETISAPTNNAGSLVQYYGTSGPYTIKNWTYDSLELSSSSATTYNLSVNLTANNTVTIDANNTLDLVGHNLSATSVVNNGILRLKGSETVSTVTNNSGSLVQYYGTSGPYSVKNWTYYDLEFSSASSTTYDLVADATVNHNLTIDANNALDLSGYNLTVTTINNHGTLYLQGGETVTVTSVNNYAPSLVQYYGTAGPYTVKNWTYYNLVFASTSAATYNLGANLSALGSIGINTNNTLDASGYNISTAGLFNHGVLRLEGSETISAPTNTAGSLVQYYGTAGPYTVKNWTYENLEFSSASTTTYNLGANLTVNHTLTIDTNNILDAAGHNIAATTSIVNNGTLRLQGGETITVAPTNNTGSLIQYYGTSGPYTIKNWAYYNIELSSASSTVYNLGASLTVNNALTIDVNNTLDTVGHDITATSFINNGIFRLYGNETISTPTNNAGSLVQYYGTSGPYNIKNWTYDSLELASSSTTTYNLIANLTVNSTLTIDVNNTLNIAGHNVAANSIVNNGVLRLMGYETVSTVTNNTGSLVQYYGTTGPYTVNNWTYYNVEFSSGSATTYDLGANLTVNNTLTIDANNTLDASGYNISSSSIINNGILRLEGNETVSTVTNNAGSLVQYYGTSGPYTINNWTYDSLELSSASTTTYVLGANLTVNNALTIDVNNILDLSGHNLTAASFVNNGTLRLKGSETSTAPTNNAGSLVQYYGISGPYTVKNWVYYNLEFSSGAATTYNLGANLTVNNTLTIDTSNTLDAAGYNITATTSLINNGILRLQGSETISTTTNNTGSLVQYYGTSGPYTIKNWIYYNLELASSTTTTYTLGANLTVNGTLTIDVNNTLDLNGYNITSGTFINTGILRLVGNETIGTVINQTGSLVYYYGTSGPYTVKNWTYYNVEFASASATTWNLGANLAVNNNLTIDSGNTLDLKGFNALATSSIINNGILRLKGNEAVSTVTNNTGSLVQYYGTSGPYTVNNWTYYNLEFASISAATYNLGANVTINNTLTIDSNNTLDVAGYNLTATSFVNNGILRLKGSETVTAPTNNAGSLVQYYGTAGPYTINNWIYNNLELSSASATVYDLAHDLTVNSTLTIDAGNTLDVSGYNLAATSFINNGTIRLQGSETISIPTNNTGSLVQYYGTSGPYTVKSWTYYNLEFASASATSYGLGANLTVNNLLTIDVNNTLDVAGNNITATNFINNGILRLQGNETISTPTNNTGSLVQYYGTVGPYTVNNWTYYNVEFASSSAATFDLAANLTVNNILTIDVNNTLDASGFNITTSTSLINNGILRLIGTETISTPTNNVGSLVQYYGTSGPYTVKNWIYYNLEFSSSSSTTYNLGVNLTVNNTLTIDANNILDVSGHNITAASFINNGTLRLQGNETISTPTNNAGSLVQYYGTSGPYTVKNWTYYDVEFASSSSTTYNLGANLTVNDTLTIDVNNTLDASGYNIAATTSLVNNGILRLQGSETITAPTDNIGSLVQYYGTSGPYTVKPWVYYNVEFSSSSATTYDLGANLAVTHTLTIDTNNTLDVSGYNLSSNSIINNGILRLQGNETVTAPTNNVGSLVQYYGTSGPYTVNNWTYYNVEFSSASAATYNLGTNLTVNNILTIDVNNTVDLSGHNLMVATIVNNGILRLIGSETVTVTTVTNNAGSLVQYYGTSGPYTIKPWTYYNVEFSSASANSYLLGGNLVVTGTLTVDVSNTLDLAGFNLTVGTIVNNGIIKLKGNETVTVTTDNNNAGSLVEYYGTAGPYTIQNWTYYDLQFISVSAATFNLGAALTVNNALTVGANSTLNLVGYDVTTTIFTNNGTIRLQGNEVVSTIPTNNTGSLVQYDSSSGSDTIKNWVYYNLELASSTSTLYTLGANLTVNILTVDVNNILDVAGYNMTASSVINNGTLRLQGHETISSLTNNVGSLVQYYGTSGPYTLQGFTFYDLELASATATTYNLVGNFVINHNLTIDANNTLDVAGYNLTANSVINNGILRLQGHETLSSLTNNTGSLVQYYGTSGPYVFQGWTYYNLELASATATVYNLVANFVVVNQITIDVNNTLNLQGHNLTSPNIINNGTLKMQGSETVSTVTNNAGSLVQYDGTAGPYTIKPWIYYNLELASATSTVYMLGANATIDNNVTIDVNNTLDVTSNNYNMTVGGNWSNAGVFMARAGTVTFSSNSIQTLNAGGSSFYNVVHSGSGTLELINSALTITHRFINTAGIFDLNGENWTMTGVTFSNPGTIELQGGETIIGLVQDATQGTWEYIGDNTGNTYTIKDYTYYNLIVNDTHVYSDTFILNQNISLNDVTIDSGILSSGNYNINLSGNWNNLGTFLAGTSTVNFDGGDQEISGSTTFYNLTKTNSGSSILTFQAGELQTVKGALTLKASKGQWLSLRSTISGTQWMIDPQGTSDVNYIDIQDGNNIDVNRVVCPDQFTCHDSGDNTNFYFVAPPNPLLLGWVSNLFTILDNQFMKYDYLYNTDLEDNDFYSFEQNWDIIFDNPKKKKKVSYRLKKVYPQQTVTIIPSPAHVLSLSLQPQTTSPIIRPMPLRPVAPTINQ